MYGLNPLVYRQFKIVEGEHRSKSCSNFRVYSFETSVRRFSTFSEDKVSEALVPKPQSRKLWSYVAPTTTPYPF